MAKVCWLAVVHEPRISQLPRIIMGFPDGSPEKNLPAMQETQETWVQSLGWKSCGNGNPLKYSCL